MLLYKSWHKRQH